MKRFFLALILIPAAFALFANGQYCGGDRRIINLVYAKGDQPPPKVSYQLFYLGKPGEAAIEGEKQWEFVSEFMYGDPKAESGRFWNSNLNEGGIFLSPPAWKAEQYIAEYPEKEFEKSIPEEMRRLHFPQLSGAAKDSRIIFETSETDPAVFLMRIMAEGYETQYFVEGFMSGCFGRGRHQQKIEMKRSYKDIKPCK